MLRVLQPQVGEGARQDPPIPKFCEALPLSAGFLGTPDSSPNCKGARGVQKRQRQRQEDRIREMGGWMLPGVSCWEVGV